MDDDPERYLSIMDAAGVDVTCLNCVFYGDARRGNDAVAEAVARHPDRFVGAAFVTPHYPEEAVVELDRAFGELNMKFVKVYPDYAMKLPEDPSYGPILEWCSARELPVMLHSTFLFEPPNADVYKRYTGLHKRYPGIKWVIAHGASSVNPAGCEAARELPAVYLETCGSGTANGAVEYAVEHAGADRVLFGTDSPIMDGRQQIAKVVTADISDEDKIKILGLNAVELLGLDPR